MSFKAPTWGPKQLMIEAAKYGTYFPMVNMQEMITTSTKMRYLHLMRILSSHIGYIMAILLLSMMIH